MRQLPVGDPLIFEAVAIILATGLCWYTAKATMRALRADEADQPTPRNDEFEFEIPHLPSRQQKGDPDPEAWPWELTADEGPE